ncbi:MAG TPA: c-type cytochrome [Alphaproteobacteria bacterium]
MIAQWVLIAHAVLAAVGSADPARAQMPRGDPEAGRVLAQHKCAGCHAIADGQRLRPAAGVPTFSDIARKSTSDISLRAFSHPPHPAPDVALRRRQVDDLVSYILNLRQQLKPAVDSCCKAENAGRASARSTRQRSTGRDLGSERGQ